MRGFRGNQVNMLHLAGATLFTLLLSLVVSCRHPARGLLWLLLLLLQLLPALLPWGLLLLLLILLLIHCTSPVLLLLLLPILQLLCSVCQCAEGADYTTLAAFLASTTSASPST